MNRTIPVCLKVVYAALSDSLKHFCLLCCTGLPRRCAPRNDGGLVYTCHCEERSDVAIQCKKAKRIINKIPAFSLVELLISVIIISVVVAAFAPVMTKRLKTSQIALSSDGEITTECQSSPNYGNKCELCTKKYCIKCGLESCDTGQFVDVKKCDCSDCKTGFPDAYGNQCIQCNSQGCTRCASSAYYVNNGKCEKCPTGHYCDGVNDYASCPSDAGYYCDSTGIHKCTDAYHSACTRCNASTCTACGGYYYRTGKVCAPCNMTACTQCLNTNYCTACSGDWILNTSTHKCDATCISKMEGCYTCTSASYCTNCHGGYYLNSGHTCTKCTIANCQKCVNNRSAGSQACESCRAGYYLQGGACYSCASKFGSACAACTPNECTSCNQGYTIKTSTANPACVSNDNKFGCSDSNFMQIGNLCVTRKNMGDSYALTIPSSVTIAQSPSEYCYSTNQLCCWKGETTNYCDAANGGYSGCTRTVCNWNAAKEICSKFNYQGRTWRLPTNAEMKSWFISSIGLAGNGLQLCDNSPGYSSARCSNAARCPGSYNGNCNPNNVWSGQVSSSLVSYNYNLNAGVWYGPNTNYASNAFSVRCVRNFCPQYAGGNEFFCVLIFCAGMFYYIPAFFNCTYS